MKRRRVLAVVGAASMGSLSGCTIAADLLDDSEDEEGDIPTPVDVDESETPEPTETPDSDDEGITFSQPDSGSSDGSSSETDAGDSSRDVPDDHDERWDILTTYSEGVEQVNEGIRAREDAVGAFNVEDYGRSSRRARDAVQSFRQAETEYREAQTLAIGISQQQAADMCATAVEYATVMEEAQQELGQAADLAGRGRADSSSEHIDRFQELELEAERLNPVEPTALQSVLDIGEYER